MDSIIEKITYLTNKEEQPIIKQMMANEKHLYVELNLKKGLLNTLWLLSLAIHSKKVIVMHYIREVDELATKRKVKPVGITFEAGVFDKGTKMWLLSQGVFVEVLEPKAFRDEFSTGINTIAKKYTNLF